MAQLTPPDSASLNRLTLLGTGTARLGIRDASAALFQTNGLNVVLDMGHGAAKALAKLVPPSELRHLIFSHFHPDHWNDLSALLHHSCWAKGSQRKIPLNIYGPKNIDPNRRNIHQLFAHIEETFGPEEHSLPNNFVTRVTEVTDNHILIEGTQFEFVDLPHHSNHGVALTVNGKRFAHAADAYATDQLVAFGKGADVLIADYGHCGENLIDIAVRAQPKKLVLSHLHDNDEPNMSELVPKFEAAGYRGQVILGQDGMFFDFN